MHVFADDITMSSEQSDYYYLAGTDAQVPFTIDSSFTNTLIGTLQYSLTRKQDDGGFSISQTNTQSQSFPIAPGRSDHALTLTSESETNYDLSLLLIYEDKGKDFAVVLPPISVHFVSEQKDVKQVKETLRSTTSEATKTPSSLSGQDPFSQMEQEMEQMRQEQQQMMQNLLSQSGSGYSTRQSSPQNSQQALQNNQMSSSSSALKQQMMQESQQTEENKRKLADSLEKDPIVQKQASDLRNAGYNQTSVKIVPSGPDLGEYRFNLKIKTEKKLR
jgi:membrane-associated HD superfamily phosphohydrolase